MNVETGERDATDGGTALELICRARSDLVQARSIQDVKEVRDKAEAVRNFLRQRGESLDAQNEAAEIKLWAERRAGELLMEMEMSKGGRPLENPSHDVTGYPRLRELGIERMQSHRWQRSAVIPEDEFVRHIVGVKERGGELTSAGIQVLAKSLLKDNDTPEVAQANLACAESLESMIEAGMKFGCIYADPPWKYGNQATRASTDNHYSTMAIDDIAALPIGDLAADKSHLWLWTTNGFLFECPKLFQSWGFEFKSSYIWVKPQIGIGNYLRNAHEFLLLATRGGLVGAARNVKSWGQFDRTKHSVKPDAICSDVVERISPGPRLELFGRRLREGWTVWGNEVPAAVETTRGRMAKIDHANVAASADGLSPPRQAA